MTKIFQKVGLILGVEYYFVVFELFNCAVSAFHKLFSEANLGHPEFSAIFLSDLVENIPIDEGVVEILRDLQRLLSGNELGQSIKNPALHFVLGPLAYALKEKSEAGNMKNS